METSKDSIADMETSKDSIADVWQGWFKELENVVLPSGMGPHQRFAIGQTTLMVDFANADPEIANAEVFRIGNTTPAASPNFAPTGRLFDAYKYFLSGIQSTRLDSARATIQKAESQTQTLFNMKTKHGTLAPRGSQPTIIGGPTPALSSTLQSRFLPAYQLGGGFRQQYQEWQSLSTRGNSTAGGTITVLSRIGAGGSSPTTSQEAAQPDFFRVMPSAPPAVADLSGAETTLQPSIARSAPGAELPASFTSAKTASTFTLRVSFTGLGTFSMSPARWWSTTAIRLFENKLKPREWEIFFGENGNLARRVFQVVLGFQPTLELSFSDQSMFKSVRDSYRQPTGGGVGIGPFNVPPAALVQGSGGVSTYSEANQTITIGPIKSTLPILLGVVTMDTLKDDGGDFDFDDGDFDFDDGDFN